MMRSMYSGVSGLRVHQTKMDVIGNNIANVNTIGYKSQRVNFTEVFSQTLQSGSGASEETGRGGVNPMQVGLGVNVSSIDMLMTRGAAQRTDNPFDLMIDGDGFLAVSDGSGTYFTRAGALRQDDNGNLVIPNGMKVQGWPPTEDGKKIKQGEVQDIELSSPGNKFATPEATKEATISGNLNKNDSPHTTQIKMYDSLGNLYTTPIEFKFDDTDPAKPVWTMKPIYTSAPTPPATQPAKGMMVLTDTAGNKYAVPDTFNGGGDKPVELKFDANGKLMITPPADKVTFDIGKFDMENAIDADEKSKTYGKPKPLKATVGGINMDVSNLTQYNSKTNVDPKTVDGKAPGTLQGFDVGGDGKITAYYDNGSTKLLGQIIIAEFDNPAGLEKAGDNLFKTTANSGDFDRVGKAGIFQAGVLEMSNVDLSREFTEMITTQRGFQANSRIISVSDEMLQELVNLKR